MDGDTGPMLDDFTWSDLLDMELKLGSGGLSFRDQEKLLSLARELLEDCEDDDFDRHLAEDGGFDV
jgi:hypothetical protein